MSSPVSEYESRLAFRREQVATLEKTEDRLATGRLLCFIFGVVLGIYLFRGQLPLLYLVIPVVIFIALVAWHLICQDRIAVIRRVIQFYEQGMRRMRHEWIGDGNSGESYRVIDHVYARDLDIFGEGSLFELLCTARTPAGESTLAQWLLSGAERDEIQRRQSAVEALRDRVDLREDLGVMGNEIRSQVHPDSLIQWAESTEIFPAWVQGASWVCGIAAIVTGLGWAFADWGPIPFFGVILVEYLVGLSAQRAVEGVTGGVSELALELNLIALAIERFEKESFEGNCLQQVTQNLSSDGVTASRAIRRLELLVSWLDAKRNQFFAPIAIVLMWDVHLSFFIQRWRGVHGKRVKLWLSALGELEALSSLACFSFENPSYPFPVILDEPQRFEGNELGHPLLNQQECVRNSVSLTATEKVWLVSGSNMSGKSTLLRTVGLNTVLALSGAPVCGSSLTLSCVCLGASIQVYDSLHTGTSRFYAEISHLKSLLELSQKEQTFLFLIDEIFSGTNSHDRRIGATALIKEFIARESLGLLTTHDLELTKIAEDTVGVVRNVHFQDQFADGKLKFDYRVHEGVVERSNAIELMRSVGLPV